MLYVSPASPYNIHWEGACAELSDLWRTSVKRNSEGKKAAYDALYLSKRMVGNLANTKVDRVVLFEFLTEGDNGDQHHRSLC